MSAWQHLAAGDAFAIVMLAVIALSFGTVLVLLVSMLRHSGRRDLQVEQLIEQTRREQQSPPPGRPPAGDPWERHPDWWNQADDKSGQAPD
jgi:hypothetical protein